MESPIEVPISQLSEETLQALVESFVLREGTDYGAVEVSLEMKVKQVRRQLESGEALLVYDSETDSVTLIPAPPKNLILEP